MYCSAESSAVTAKRMSECVSTRPGIPPDRIDISFLDG